MNVNKIKSLLKYRIVPIGIAGVAVFSGCSRGYGYRYKDSSIDQNTVSIAETQPREIELDSLKPLVDIKDENECDINIKIDDDNYNSYINYLNGLSIDFPYSDLFKIENVLKKYDGLVKISNHNTKLDSLDSVKLMNVVKYNNKEFKKNASSSYKLISDNDLFNICDTIIRVCNDYLSEHKEISLSRLLCVLSDLKVFNKASFNNAFVTNDNCLIISSNMIDMTKMVKKDDISYKVLIHEINHLLQKGCNCEIQNNSLISSYGFSNTFSNVDVNSMDYSWFYEATAEKNMSDYLGCEPITYKSLIGYLDSMVFINGLDKNHNIDDVESLAFSRDINKLYDYFNAESEKEKMDVLKMMYSIQILQCDPTDFYDNYLRVYGGKKDDALLDKIRYQVKSSICSKFSNLFYRNLATCLNENIITLEDVFYIITVFESDLNNHLDYTNENKYQYNEYFFEKYTEIQSDFFYYLSSSIGINQNQLEKLFNNYTVYSKDKHKKCKLNFLKDDKIKFLNYIEDKYKLKATYNISNTYNYFSEKNYCKIK